MAEGSLSARNAFASAAEAAAAGLRKDDRLERRDVILNDSGEPVEETEEVRGSPVLVSGFKYSPCLACCLCSLPPLVGCLEKPTLSYCSRQTRSLS